MARYSLAQVQTRLHELVHAAQRGEEVLIDQPDADIEVKLVAHRVRPNGPNDIEWLEAVRVRPRRGSVNTAKLLSDAKTESRR